MCKHLSHVQERLQRHSLACAAAAILNAVPWEIKMSDDFLKNPASLFDVKGKTAIVTGATGAFGTLAAKVLAGAGANVVIAASKADVLKKVAAECEKLGGKAHIVNKRPNSEEN